MDARPDKEEMEQAINNFLQRLEKQEKRGFKDLATLLSQLPKLAQGSARSISVAEAVEAGFLPALDKDQAYMFTPSELPLYQHAQDHRLLTLDILGYPCLFGDILGQPLISKVIPFSGGQWRFNEESRDPPPPRGSQARR